MDFIIKPFEGINEIKFGMFQSEVEAIIGKSEETKTALLNNILEFRNDIIFVYINEKLSDIRFSKSCQYEKHNIVLNDIVLNNDENTVNKLIKMPKTLPSEIVKNCIVFYGIGACFAGFKEGKIRPDRELRFFSKERLGFYKIFLNA